MKNFLVFLLLLDCFATKAQVYNNEWIDYSKTYYKFKVGKTGLYRINGAALAANGLGTAPAQQFQLWRNGKEIPIYTSVAIGSFSSNNYIEFWGEMNDGKADAALYRQPEFQLNDKWSLETDTSVYFLTLNPTGNNLRLVPTANNVAGNTLQAEPYFMHTLGNYFRTRVVVDTIINGQSVTDTLLNEPFAALPRPGKDFYSYRINPGYAVNVGEYLYSSSYDKGEGFSSLDIGSGGSSSTNFKNLFVYPAGPAPLFRINTSGNTINVRKYQAQINGQFVIENNVDYLTYTRDSTTFPISIIANNNAYVTVTNLCTTPNDRMVVHKLEMTYPRVFNFGGASGFTFSLPASAAGNYLEIKGFNYGSIAPVLYDLTNGKRYTADITNPSILKVVLEPSATERSLVLVSQETTNYKQISTLESRSFTNYSLAANAGDYLIISNAALLAGSTTNPLEEYRAYRSSTDGGSYKAKVYFIQDLTDQFAFGIKVHPNAIRIFLRYARAKFPTPLKHVLLIGKGVNYTHHRTHELNADLAKLNFVPTFGWPASDVLLSAEPGSGVPITPIGRLSVINASEIALYLKKVKEFEAAQRLQSPAIADKAWMKNVVHIVGASEPGLQIMLDGYMAKYKAMIEDTLFGAKVTTFSKSSPDAVEQVGNGALDKLFEEGISLITYFGHSSSSTLEFNLNDPDQYNNQGKYPLFIGLGCNAGNFYNFNTARLLTKETLSEKYVLAPDRGTIGFVASSHFGIVHYLDITNTRQYKAIGYQEYGKSIGEIMQRTITETFDFTSEEDFYARAQCEETSLHGDPAITLNPHKKPDYVIEQSMLKLAPNFVSVADNSFRLQAAFINQGKAIDRAIVLEVKQEYPDGSAHIIKRDTVPGIRFTDSLIIDVPIVASRDKGLNKITVTVDADNVTEELYETNNSITREFFIYEDEARPVFPYNYAIVNEQGIKLKASTANPFSAVRQYRMELDTSAAFTSPLSVQTTSAPGGVIEFDPGINFTDSTVYYWRIASVPDNGQYTWNSSSFIYLSGLEAGLNQSHYFQHKASVYDGIILDSVNRNLVYDSLANNLTIRNGVFFSATGQEADLTIAVHGIKYIRSACAGGTIVFNLFDPNSFKPLTNLTGFMGSAGVCEEGRRFNFEYTFLNQAGRKKAMDFMDWIPNGYFVVVRNILVAPTPGAYAPVWQADEATFGAGNSLYHRLKNLGLSTIDSFNSPKVFAFVYQKGPSGFTPVYQFSNGQFDVMNMSVDIKSPDSIGYVTSPQFGPAKAWKELHWSGTSQEANSFDNAVVSVIGIKTDGTKDTVLTNITPDQPVVDISAISAAQYPYLQLHLQNKDNVNFTPYQLKYWRLTYDPAPEGAVVPAVLFNAPDSLDIGQPANFKLAFKNVSAVPFDSLRVKVVLLDQNNIQHELLNEKRRPLPVNDTLHINYNYDNRKYPGVNNVFMEFNPDSDQPEQYHFNNFVYRNLYVKGDTLNPLLDVTFDNSHILNGDIISAKPNILIKLKDEAKWMLLDTASLLSVQVRYPDGNGELTSNSSTRNFAVDNDTLKFIPAEPAPNSNNTATMDFNPHFTQDGNYELIVTGRDKSSNKAGTIEYRVGFQVISKAMISNMLNYPNPFTTSTAFVFTITGSEVPQNIKIQILTVTGKIVREITKEELGPLQIGKNITDFKWDGTDQYGQKLANGVYIYRVVTNLNGKSLERYQAKGDDTDKYFNKGYGKMYLMR